MTLFGIDVSRYQGSVDWTKVKAAGISFATIKASEGAEHETATATRDYFRREFPRARAAGLTVGAYHVVRSGNVGEQVSWYLRQLAAAGANPLEIVNQIDFEKWSYDFPSYTSLKAFIRALKTAAPVAPVLYTGKWIWDQVSGDPADAESDLGVPLWDSNYGANPNTGFKQAYPGDGSSRWRSYGGWETTILQYGSKTIVPGVTGGCDANAFQGSLEEFRGKFIALKGAADVNLTDKVSLPQWVIDHFADDPGIADGSILVQTALAGGYAYGRIANEKVDALTDVVAAVKAQLDQVAVGGVDVDALAARTADLLAQRLQS